MSGKIVLDIIVTAILMSESTAFLRPSDECVQLKTLINTVDLDKESEQSCGAIDEFLNNNTNILDEFLLDYLHPIDVVNFEQPRCRFEDQLIPTVKKAISLCTDSSKTLKILLDTSKYMDELTTPVYSAYEDDDNFFHKNAGISLTCTSIILVVISISV